MNPTEDQIDALNDVIARQRAEIEKLSAALEQIAQLDSYADDLEQARWIAMIAIGRLP